MPTRQEASTTSKEVMRKGQGAKVTSTCLGLGQSASPLNRRTTSGTHHVSTTSTSVESSKVWSMKTKLVDAEGQRYPIT